jgi:protein-L-isoaspartate(D-aspartate) O-methyltransferase
LIDQLKEGGAMVIPVGSRYQQVMHRMRKRDGSLVTEALQPTLFVPMTGAAEDARQQQPDPLHPALFNSGFEETPPQPNFVPGWYYQRQLTWIEDKQAPEGSHYVSFDNREAGKPAIVMQGFPIDGRTVTRLEVSAWVRSSQIRAGRDGDELPAVVVTFYDEGRKDLGSRSLGPFRAESPWKQHHEVFRVPASSREAILRIGLFGATGQIAFDDVRVQMPSTPDE